MVIQKHVLLRIESFETYLLKPFYWVESRALISYGLETRLATSRVYK